MDQNQKALSLTTGLFASKKLTPNYASVLWQTLKEATGS